MYIIALKLQKKKFGLHFLFTQTQFYISESRVGQFLELQKTRMWHNNNGIKCMILLSLLFFLTLGIQQCFRLLQVKNCLLFLIFLQVQLIIINQRWAIADFYISDLFTFQTWKLVVGGSLFKDPRRLNLQAIFEDLKMPQFLIFNNKIFHCGNITLIFQQYNIFGNYMLCSWFSRQNIIIRTEKKPTQMPQIWQKFENWSVKTENLFNLQLMLNLQLIFKDLRYTNFEVFNNSICQYGNQSKVKHFWKLQVMFLVFFKDKIQQPGLGKNIYMYYFMLPICTNLKIGVKNGKSAKFGNVDKRFQEFGSAPQFNQINLLKNRERLEICRQPDEQKCCDLLNSSILVYFFFSWICVE
eukprot:TRINITY_DN18582_c0_g1_i5.p1 TRINITY_DN18582_c0_g1~~TRINITY_DN18582_c0_g1_i5.p1  ORF type:complete len:354 (+),score=-7.52 TRINITY_DN18582_c0_g1_i5:425-1486(+)